MTQTHETGACNECIKGRRECNGQAQDRAWQEHARLVRAKDKTYLVQRQPGGKDSQLVAVKACYANHRGCCWRRTKRTLSSGWCGLPFEELTQKCRGGAPGAAA